MPLAPGQSHGEGTSLTIQGLIASLCILGNFGKETIFSNSAPIRNKIMMYYH